MTGIRHASLIVSILLILACHAAPLAAQPVDGRAGHGEAAALDEYHARSRAVVEQVLATEEFEDLSTADDAWLERWIERFRGFLQDVRSGIDQLPVWVHQLIIGWMILTLVAILLHLIYTLWQSLGGEGGGKAGREAEADPSEPGLLGVRELDFDTVFARAMTLLEAERFDQAVRYLYAAAILYLDRQGRLHFGPAKTNRDYLQELAPGDPAHPPLHMMTRRFETIVFGQRSADRTAADAMARALASLRDTEMHGSPPRQEPSP